MALGDHASKRMGVLELIKYHPALAERHIADALKLSDATVWAICRELRDSRLIRIAPQRWFDYSMWEPVDLPSEKEIMEKIREVTTPKPTDEEVKKILGELKSGEIRRRTPKQATLEGYIHKRLEEFFS